MISLYETIVKLNQLVGGSSFQTNKEPQLRSFLSTYQTIISEKRNLNQAQVADIARMIVLNQYFNDRNHRTGILFCYFYNLMNNRMLRVKPYKLYAAMKGEEEKFVKLHDAHSNNNSDQNQIYIAMMATTYRKCIHQEQAKLFDLQFEQTLHLHKKLERLLNEKHSNSALTQQRKIYARYVYSKSVELSISPEQLTKRELSSAFPKHQTLSSHILTEPLHIRARHAPPSPVTLYSTEEFGNFGEVGTLAHLSFFNPICLFPKESKVDAEGQSPKLG